MLIFAEIKIVSSLQCCLQVIKFKVCLNMHPEAKIFTEIKILLHNIDCCLLALKFKKQFHTLTIATAHNRIKRNTGLKKKLWPIIQCLLVCYQIQMKFWNWDESQFYFCCKLASSHRRMLRVAFVQKMVNAAHDNSQKVYSNASCLFIRKSQWEFLRLDIP